MKKLLLFVVCVLCTFALSAKTRDVKVLQWNIWQEGAMIKGGYDAIIDEIVRLKPDFVTFSEVRNYRNTRFYERVIRSLAQRNETYYSFLTEDSGLLSRHPITDSTTVYPLKDDHGSMYRLVASIEGQEFAIFTGHLDYLNDGHYNAIGYHGSNWHKIPIPGSVAEILNFNDASRRDDAIREFIHIAQEDVAKGRVVILGGDLNEPSHLDWIRETKDMYDHHGFIIPWTVSLALDNAGYVDAYRERYPDVVKYPGFTYPSDNPLQTLEKLTFAPEADERERIDYIYYYPHEKIRLKDITIFGPNGYVERCKRVKKTSPDPLLTPLGIWPSDHHGLLAIFKLKYN